MNTEPPQKEYNKSEQLSGITYRNPTVTLLHATPLVNAEIAGRTAYQSFDKSEHHQVAKFTGQPVEDVESSSLLSDLAWTYFHHSVLEHVTLTYAVTTTRGVLQELSRHRVASPTVQSTRYTMTNILYAFLVSQLAEDNIEFFTDALLKLDMLVVEGAAKLLEIEQLYNKLELQFNLLGKEKFYSLVLSKSNLEYFKHCTVEDVPLNVYRTLQAGKSKRNVGDHFKWVVTDTWKVDLVLTINLRSLKNFITLRDSGSAYFLIRNVAKAIQAVTPKKYLDLVVKDTK